MHDKSYGKGIHSILEFPESSILFQNIFFLFSNNIDRLVVVPHYKNEAVWELLVVPKLNGRAHKDTSEGGWKDLPVPDRVAVKTHGSVGSLSGLV